MNGNTEIGREWLRRMIALLLSFAGLAEQASTRSSHIRRNVLHWLRAAELGAFQSVTITARALGAPVPACAIVEAGYYMAECDDYDEPQDAIHLASRFRALAIALTLLLALAEQQAAASAGPSQSGMSVSDKIAMPPPVDGLAGWGSLHQPAVLVPP